MVDSAAIVLGQQTLNSSRPKPLTQRMVVEEPIRAHP